MSEKYTKHLQLLITEDMYYDLSRLLMAQALEKGEPIPTMSKYLRSLLEEILNDEANKEKIENWNPRDIRHIKR